MNFLDWKRERFIRKTLRKLSGQRVGLILQPGNIWVIEKSVPREDKVDEALRTCHLRGWVEPIVNAIPQGSLTQDGNIPESMSDIGPVYRLTEAGWSAIKRTHDWVVVTCLIAFAALVGTIISLIIKLWGG